MDAAEEMEREVCRELAARRLPLRVSAVRNALRVSGYTATEVEVERALELLGGLTPPLVELLPDELGRRFWKISAAGVIWDRNHP